MTLLVSIALIGLAFFCGSLPFSVWVGKIFLGVDVRQFGDGNPGAVNVFRSGNKLAGLLVLLLDISKAAAPVGLAYFNLHMRGITMILIAIAPILGHAFSPFLGFKGGKALATALGVWIGLTIWKASLPAALMAAIGIALFTPPGWSVMLALAGILVVLLIWLPEPAAAVGMDGRNNHPGMDASRRPAPAGSISARGWSDFSNAQRTEWGMAHYLTHDLIIHLIIFQTVLLLIILSNIFIIHRSRRHSPPPAFPLVSILVPARNEEGNIAGCIQSLLAQDYPAFEVLVLDDQSEDNTRAILEKIAENKPRLRVLDGAAPPEGQIGQELGLQPAGPTGTR